MFSKRVSASTSSKGRSAGYSQAVASSKVAGKGTHSAAGSPKSPEAVVIPYIKTQDNAKLLPKYAAALGRPKDEYLPAEDLDTVQCELESLLSNVALRYRVLKSEYESVEKDEWRDRRKFIEKQPTSPGKRKRVDDKKAKERTLPHLKLAKQKNPTAHSPAQSQHTDDSMDATLHYQPHQKQHTKASLLKNDTPNKFWLSVEPFCMPLTNEDLKLLDDLLEQYSGPLVPPIPELGPHYSTTFAAEDFKEEQVNSNSSIKSKASQHGSSNSEVFPEAAIVIPYIKTQDNAKLLPKYTAALSRPKDECLPAEDLDTVQCELESLLSNVALRYRVLKSEYESVEKDEWRDRRKFIEKQPTSPGKRKRVDDKKTKERTLPHMYGMLTKGEKVMGEGVTGPLTQRLVSALMEENVMNDGFLNADSSSSSENTYNTTNSLRSLNMMQNGISIEKRVKKELIDQGILDPDDYEKGQEDEILSEIKRVLAELSAIAEYNCGELRRLRTAAKAELQRLEVKRKLDAVDQQIIETYKNIEAAKQKRRPLTTEEQEEVYRLTSEQKRLSDQLESMPAPGPNLVD